MAAVKPLRSFPSASRAALVLLLIALAAQAQMGRAQECSQALANLMTCAPYVVPGNHDGAPSTQCCSALKAVNHTCLCNTLNIIARLPTGCNLPGVTCPST